MKKQYLAAVVCSALALGTYAGEPVLDHEIHAGLAVGRLRHSNYSGKAGFTAGWKMDYRFKAVEGLYVGGGVDVTQKGFRANGNRANMFYALVPLHAGYRYAFSRTWAAYGEFGPYFGAGLGGKEHLDKGNVKIFAGNGLNAKRSDWGLGFRLGTEFQRKYTASLGFDWGCYDLSPKGDKDKTFTFSLTVGYKL